MKDKSHPKLALLVLGLGIGFTAVFAHYFPEFFFRERISPKSGQFLHAGKLETSLQDLDNNPRDEEVLLRVGGVEYTVKYNSRGEPILVPYQK